MTSFLNGSYEANTGTPWYVPRKLRSWNFVIWNYQRTKHARHNVTAKLLVFGTVRIDGPLEGL